MIDVDEVYTLEQRITRDLLQEEDTTTVKKKKKKKKKSNKYSLKSCINIPSEEKESLSSICYEKATESVSSFKDTEQLDNSSVDDSVRDSAQEKSKVLSDDNWGSEGCVSPETTAHDQKKNGDFGTSGHNVLPVNVTKTNQNTNGTLSCASEHVVDKVKDIVSCDATSRIPELQVLSGYEAKTEPSADEEIGTPATFFGEALQGNTANYLLTLHDGCARTRGSRKPSEQDNKNERNQIHAIIATNTGKDGPSTSRTVEYELPTEPQRDTIVDSLSLLQYSCARTRGSRKSLVLKDITGSGESLSTTFKSTSDAEPEANFDADNGQQANLQSNASQGDSVKPLSFFDGSSARTRGWGRTLLCEGNTDYIVEFRTMSMTSSLCEVESSSGSAKTMVETIVKESVVSAEGFKPTEAISETKTTVPLIDSATARHDCKQLGLPKEEHEVSLPVVPEHLPYLRKDRVDDLISEKVVPVMVSARTEDFTTMALQDSDNIRTVTEVTQAKHYNLQSNECFAVSSVGESRAEGPLDTNPAYLTTEEQKVDEHNLVDRGCTVTDSKDNVCSSVVIPDINDPVPLTEGITCGDSASQAGYTAAKSDDAGFSEAEQGVAHSDSNTHHYSLCIESSAPAGDEDNKNLGANQIKPRVSKTVSNLVVNIQNIRTTCQLPNECGNRHKDETSRLHFKDVEGDCSITKQGGHTGRAMLTQEQRRVVATETLLPSDEVLIEKSEIFPTTIETKCSSQPSSGLSETKARFTLVQQPSFENDGETEQQQLERNILEETSATLRHTTSEIILPKQMKEESSLEGAVASELMSLSEVSKKNSNNRKNDKLEDKRDRHETNLLGCVQHASEAEENQKLQLMNETTLGIMDTNQCSLDFDRPCKENANKEMKPSSGKEQVTASVRVTDTILDDKGEVSGHVKTDKTKTCQLGSELYFENTNLRGKSEVVKTVGVMQSSVSENVRQFIKEKESIQKADRTFTETEAKQSRVECTEEEGSLLVRLALGSAEELLKDDVSLKGEKGNKQHQSDKQNVTREQRDKLRENSDVDEKHNLVSCEDFTVVITQETSTDTKETMRPVKKCASIIVKHKEKEVVACSEDNIREFVSTAHPTIQDKSLLPNYCKLKLDTDPGSEKEEGEISSSEEEVPDAKEHSKETEKAGSLLDDDASFSSVRQLGIKKDKEDKEEGELTSTDDEECPIKKQAIQKEPAGKASRRAKGRSSTSRRKGELSRYSSERTSRPPSGKDMDGRKSKSTVKTAGSLNYQKANSLSSKTSSKFEQRRRKIETRFADSSRDATKLEEKDVRRASEWKIGKEGNDCKQGQKREVRIQSKNDEKSVSEKAQKAQGKYPSIGNVYQSHRDLKSRTDSFSPKYSKDNIKTCGKSGKIKLQHSAISSTKETDGDANRDEPKKCSTSHRGSGKSVIDTKVKSLPRKDVKHQSKVSAPDTNKSEDKSSRTRSFTDKIKEHSVVGPRISNEQSRKRREKGTESETNLRDSSKFTKRCSSTHRKSSINHSTGNSKPAATEALGDIKVKRRDSPGRVTEKVLRQEEKSPPSSVSAEWKGSKRLAVGDHGDKHVKRRRLDDDDKRTATNRRNSPLSSCSQSSSGSRRQSPTRRGATLPTVRRTNRENGDRVGSRRELEHEKSLQTSRIKPGGDPVSKDLTVDNRRTSVQQAKTKIPYGGSSLSKERKYSVEDQVEISATSGKQRRHKRDKEFEKLRQQHKPPVNDPSDVLKQLNVQEHGKEETEMKAGKRESSRDNESKRSLIRFDANLSKKEELRQYRQPVNENREKTVKNLGSVKRSEGLKDQSEHAPSKTAARKLTTGENEAKLQRDKGKKRVTNTLGGHVGNSTSNVTSKTEGTTYEGHEKAKSNASVSRGSSSKDETLQRGRKSCETATKIISKAESAVESSAVNRTSQALADGSTKTSAIKKKALSIKTDNENTANEVSLSVAVKPNCEKQAIEPEAMVGTEGLDAVRRGRKLMIGRGKYLVFKRRHVNQLFVRGDNVVMVGYA